MATRNVESLTEAREAEFYDLHTRLERTLAKHGRIGTTDDCDIWVPIEIDYFRDLYIVLATPRLLTQAMLADIKHELQRCTFIWVVIVHIGTDEHDDRVLELSRTETVIFDDTPFTEHLRRELHDSAPFTKAAHD